MPFRAYKQKDIESKIASYVKSRRPVSDHAIDANKNEPVKEKKPDVAKKPKLAKKLHANPRKPTVDKKVRKKAKTLDISSFPRVFSTSDLMDKMKDQNAVQKCTFQDNEVVDTCEMRQDFDIKNVDELVMHSDDLNVQIIHDQPQREELSELVFPTANLMVFNNKRRQELEERLSQNEIDLECKQIDLRNLSNMLQEKSQDLVIKEQKEKILAQKLEQKDVQIAKMREENDILRREKTRFEKSVKDLQHTVLTLEEQLQRNNFKGHVKISEYEKLRERIREIENEREALLVENSKMKRDNKEKTDLIDSLSRRNDHLQKQNDLLNVTKKENRIYALEYRVDALSDTVNRVKHENEKLKKTYTFTVNELAEYEMKQMKLRDIIDKQKTSLKVLENTTSTENRALQNYEMEAIRLREMNRNLYTENEKFKMENARLLGLVSVVAPPNLKDNQSIAVSQPNRKDNQAVAVPSTNRNKEARSISMSAPRKENQPISMPQSNQKSNPVASSLNRKDQPVMPRKENQAQPLAMPPPSRKTPQETKEPTPGRNPTPDRNPTPERKETLPKIEPRVENQSTAPSTQVSRETSQFTESSTDEVESPQMEPPPRKQNQQTVPTYPCNETPSMDQQHIAMYLVQTPGSTPKRTSKDAFQEIQNFKTTIMQAFHRNHKSNGQ